MKEVNLDIISRDKTGKSNCKQLRNLGKIPAIIYGDKKEPTYIAIDYPKIIKELSKTGFFSTVFSLKLNKKDNSGRRGLVILVSKRRGLLNYLRKNNLDSYRNVIKKLNIRK